MLLLAAIVSCCWFHPHVPGCVFWPAFGAVDIVASCAGTASNPCSASGTLETHY